ncbi:MAG: DUF3883 domain-containing protein [Gammaproteobacteria bacterium]|nr:DUF3883 domain-containing protein [Gammaproteobacteria bacterium]MYD80657.1 DUF3883 domain-containing protein [Gammaproteobacteria bacterium]
MVRKPWTSYENHAVVADYFTMLAADLAGQQYNKAQHNRELQLRIGRSKGAIEYKHQNISAVLVGLGETWLSGYKPVSNFQASLEQVVVNHLDRNEAYIEAKNSIYRVSDSISTSRLLVEKAPSLRDSVDPDPFIQSSAVAHKFDVAGRDACNRHLGKAGEQLVLSHEIRVLEKSGRSDLARKVCWVSEELGDGLGYDIASFSLDGRLRLIEVKTTNGWNRTPFQISRNEVEISKRERDTWCLFRSESALYSGCCAALS